MIHKTKPPGFKSRFDIVSCFVKKEDKILILLRQDHKPQGNTWGLPAGKINGKESSLNAIHRELKEETGIAAPKENIQYLGKAYTRYPGYDFIFHIYKTEVNKDTQVVINPGEHKEYKWVEIGNTESLELMEDLTECIDQFYLAT